MQKSSWKNVCENDVKLVKSDFKMGAEIVQKFIKNRLRNHCENWSVKMLKKVRPRWRHERPRLRRGLGTLGPECR